MNDVILKKDEIIDRHFGELIFIDYENKLINQLANEYFERTVAIDYFSAHALEDTVSEVKGFIRLDEIRIPFRFFIDKNSNKGYSMDIALYYSVVYSRDEKFNDEHYHHINTSIKNVLREEVDDYTQKLIEALPKNHAYELSGVLNLLYFYPHIDLKNSKTMKITIDVLRDYVIYFIGHYQSVSSRFRSNMMFYYDSQTFSLTSQEFSSITTSGVDFADFWKFLFANYFKQPCMNELINSQYTSMNELLGHLNEAFKVIEMNEI